MPQIQCPFLKPPASDPAQRGSRPDSAATSTARSIHRDLLTLAGLPGQDRIRATYLSPPAPVAAAA